MSWTHYAKFQAEVRTNGDLWLVTPDTTIRLDKASVDQVLALIADSGLHKMPRRRWWKK